MTTFKQYMIQEQMEGVIEMMGDLTAIFPFIRQNDKYTGSLKVTRNTINELRNVLEQMGYEAESHQKAIFFDKKGAYPIEVIYDRFGADGMISIARHQGRK